MSIINKMSIEPQYYFQTIDNIGHWRPIGGSYGHM
jgi:hypothetical protein